MMDVWQTYADLQKKYSLLDGAQELFLYETYLRVCKDYLNGKQYGRIAIYGAGNNTAKIMASALWKELEGRVAAIVDNAYEKGDLNGIPVIAEPRLKDYSVEAVIVSSWNYRIEILQSMKDNYPDIEVFEPYSHVLEMLPQINVPFFTYMGNYKYQWFAQRNKKLESADSDQARQKLLRELMHGYFAIYDWVDLKKTILRYVENGYEDREKYISLCKDADAFLKSIQDEIEKRDQGDCLIFLVDALSKYVVEDMPLLSAWGESGVVFDRYINEYPSTRETLMTLLTGRHPFEDKTYERRKIGRGDGVLLKVIEEKQIEFKLLSEDISAEINVYTRGLNEDTLITESMFRGIGELLGSEKCQLIIMHSYDTVHPLHWNPVSSELEYDVDVSWEKHQKRFWESVSFTDGIIDFYLRMLHGNEGMTKIVMGDHGINLQTEYAHDIVSTPINGRIGIWDMETMSPALMIWHKGWQPERITQMVCTNAFHKILHAAIENKELHTVLEDRRFLELEFVPGYDKNWLERIVKSQNYYLGMGAKGIISPDYIFMSFEDDSERLFRICGRQIIECNGELPSFIEKIGREAYESCKFPKDLLSEKYFETHNAYYKGWVYCTD